MQGLSGVAHVPAISLSDALLCERVPALVEPIQSLLPVQRVSEGLESTELTNGILIQLLYAVERLFSNGLLVVSKEKTAEV